MYESLKKVLSHYVSFSEDEMTIILSKFERKTIAKNEYFLKEGAICQEVSFVITGRLILYQNTLNGQEQILDFFSDGELMTDYYSFLRKAPSENNIKAYKKSELLVISNRSINELYELVPRYETLGRKMAESAFIRLASILSSQSATPFERYQLLLTSNPKRPQEFPQYMIASYLGISAEWLSKLRART